MFKKTITSSRQKVQALKPTKKVQKQAEQSPEPQPRKISTKERGKYEFPVNSKFMLDGIVYTVRKAYFEMNTHMRQILGDDGQEIVMLRSLQKDAQSDDDFLIIP